MSTHTYTNNSSLGYDIPRNGCYIFFHYPVVIFCFPNRTLLKRKQCRTWPCWLLCSVLCAWTTVFFPNINKVFVSLSKVTGNFWRTWYLQICNKELKIKLKSCSIGFKGRHLIALERVVLLTQMAVLYAERAISAYVTAYWELWDYSTSRDICSATVDQDHNSGIFQLFWESPCLIIWGQFFLTADSQESCCFTILLHQ